MNNLDGYLAMFFTLISIVAITIGQNIIGGILLFILAKMYLDSNERRNLKGESRK